MDKKLLRFFSVLSVLTIVLHGIPGNVVVATPGDENIETPVDVESSVTPPVADVTPVSENANSVETTASEESLNGPVMEAHNGNGQNGTTLFNGTKTAIMSVTQENTWTIEKTVTPDTLNMNNGESGTVTYTIAVTETQGIPTAVMSGQICATNGGDQPTENLAILDEVTMPPSQAVIASMNVDVSSNPVLDPGETGCYNYQIDLNGVNFNTGDTFKNTAHITITNHSGHLNQPFGPSPSATVTAPAPTITHETITVEDTNGQNFPFDQSGTVTYDQTFTCGATQTHVNTATIVFDDDGTTGDSDDATVQINCNSNNPNPPPPPPGNGNGQNGTTLTGSKTAALDVTQANVWNIVKTVTPDTLNMNNGESGTVTYTITVTETQGIPVALMTGEVCIENGGAVATQDLAILDEVLFKAPQQGGPFQSLTTFSIDMSGNPVLDPGELHCYPYQVDLSGFNLAVDTKLKNTAHITITNHSGHLNQPFGPSPSSSEMTVSAPVTTTHDSIVVEDTNGQDFPFDQSGTVTYDQTFDCGATHTHVNTATIVFDDDGTTGDSDDATVQINCNSNNPNPPPPPNPNPNPPPPVPNPPAPSDNGGPSGTPPPPGSGGGLATPPPAPSGTTSDPETPYYGGGGYGGGEPEAGPSSDPSPAPVAYDPIIASAPYYGGGGYGEEPEDPKVLPATGSSANLNITFGIMLLAGLVSLEIRKYLLKRDSIALK